MFPHEADTGGCPVCGRRFDAQTHCAGCGWPLLGPWRLGGAASDEQQRFREELDRACRAFDAVAAARVSPGDGRYLPYIRGGQPDDAEWAQALLTARYETGTQGMLREVLAEATDKVTGTGRLTVVEISATGIAAFEVRADRLGSLECHAEQPVATWPELMPMLSAAPDELRFQLAGGLARLDQDQVWATLEPAVAQTVRVPAGAVVLVCTAPGWAVPERAADLLLRDHEGAESVRSAGAPVRGMLEELIAGSTLRQPYELVLAVVHPVNRRVMLQTRQLFPVGAEFGDETTLTVRCAPSDEHGTVFAIVTWHGQEPQRLSVDSVKLRPGRYRVRAVLAGPGMVEFRELPGLAPDHRTWSELTDAIPAELPPRIFAVDLICGVELGGADPGRVDARLHLVRSLIRMLDEECAEPDQLRVAVLGYGDHLYDSRQEGNRVVYGAWLSGTADALDAVDQLRHRGQGYPAATAMEDMLSHVVSQLGAATSGRRTAGRRTVLLTIGNRPPHPPAANLQSILPCPHGHNWNELLRRLERTLEVSRIAVVDRTPTGSGTVWHRLGADGLHELAEPTEPTEDIAHQLGMDIGLLVPNAHRLPFPLIEQERGRR
jgi:hypothetical protein